MKRYKYIALKAMLLLNMAHGFAQQQNQIIPPSPRAAAIEKFGDYPVSFYTGLIDISVPIYTIESDGIKVPVELKYHASGLKYDDESGANGLGWTLMATGQISSTVMGQRDSGGSTSAYNFFKNTNEISYASDCAGNTGNNLTLLDMTYPYYEAGMSNSAKDGEYDIYNYSFLNNSGKFIYPLDKEYPLLIPKKPLKISKFQENNLVSYFEITDESGVFYRFGKSLKTGTYARETPTYSSQIGNFTFLLTEIISTDKSDTVSFEYSSVNNQSRFVFNDVINIYDKELFSYMPSGKIREATNSKGWFLTYGYQLLTTIKFKKGKVTFDYDSNNRNTAIKIWDKQNQVLKTISLFQSQYHNEYYKLDSVRFQDSNLNKVYSYSFGYNGVPLSKMDASYDYWGYCNGAYQSTLVPEFKIEYYNPNNINYTPDFSITGANRDANEYNMQLGMLNRIKYPTGGYSNFIYEGHRNSSGNLEGGLRIKEVDNYESGGTFIGSKWYKYGDNESGNGRSTNPYITSSDEYCTTSMEYLLGYADVILQVMNNMRLRSYGVFPKTYIPSGSSVVYSTVTEYNGDASKNCNGKTIFSYSDYTDQPGYFSPAVSYRSDRLRYSNQWKSGQLLSKKIYKKEGTTFTPVYSQWNDFNIIDAEEYVNLRVIPYTHFSGGSTYERYPLEACFDKSSLLMPSRFVYPVTSMVQYSNYYTSSGQNVLIRTEEDNYDQQGGINISKITNYDNYNSFGMPRVITTTQSNGRSLITRYKYPSEYVKDTLNMGDDAKAIKALNDNHMISSIIEKQLLNKVGTQINLIGGELTKYKVYTNKNVFPGQIFNLQTSTPLTDTTSSYFSGNPLNLNYNSNYHSDLLFDKYDSINGNLVQYHKADNIYSSFIYGYNQTMPVAKVLNATNSQIAYTSFDIYNEGNWTYSSGILVTSTTAKAGHKYFTMSGTNCINKSLTSGKYRIEFWAKSSVSVSGGTVTNIYNSQADAKGWILNIKEIELTSNGIIYLSGTTDIDELRLYPIGAQMTTYTYDALIGMTSQTDPNGVITYYEYDNFQRLKTIKDQNGNIVKSYDYHYKLN